MKSQNLTKEQFKTELAKYGKTIQDWFEVFPLTSPDFVYNTTSIEEVAKEKGWQKKTC